MIHRLRALLRRHPPAPRLASSRATEQDVVDCFRLLLDREPDAAALAYWRALVETKHVPIRTVVDAILNSAEFKSAYASRFQPTLVRCPGFEIFVRANDLYVGQAIRQTRQYEPHVAQEIRRLLRPGHVFVDVGANVGYFTLLAATLVAPGGAVYAFEPNPDNCCLLRQSLEQNGLANVQLHQNAVAEAPKRLSLSSGSADSNARLMRTDELVGRESRFVPVDAVTLDDALADAPRVDLLKIDIEGAEPRAWQGMQSLLQRCRPVIITEYAPDLIRAASDCEPRSYLEQLWRDHAVSIIERSGATRPAQSVSEIVAAQSAAAAAGVDHLDLLACPRQGTPI